MNDRLICKRTHPGSYAKQDFRRVIKAGDQNMLVTPGSPVTTMSVYTFVAGDPGAITQSQSTVTYGSSSY